MKSGKALALVLGTTISLSGIQAVVAGISATGGTMTYIEDGGAGGNGIVIIKHLLPPPESLISIR